ncbi:hypothetical protein M9458_036877, partial [Cirrhinus mrigala]
VTCTKTPQEMARRSLVRRRRRFRKHFNYIRFRGIKHDNVTWNKSTGISLPLSFKLNDISYPTSYFDYYKIKKVVVQVWPRYNNVPSNNTNDQIILGSTAIDYDDITTSTTDTDPYKDYSTRKTWLSNRFHSRKFTPRPQVEIFKTTSVTNYGLFNVRHSPWLNAAQPDIPHYAMKLWMPSHSTATAPISFKLIISLWPKPAGHFVTGREGLPPRGLRG